MQTIAGHERRPPDVLQPPNKSRSVPDWLIVAGLLFLSLIPALAGTFRIVELTGSAEITPDNARFFASPLPVVLHILGATVYCILGAFQFSTGIRRRNPGWHRAAGRILVPSGLLAALTGVWMSHFYPWPEYDGLWLYGIRIVLGSAMAVCLVLGFAAARRRDFARHAPWMIRAYAIGLGAGTQVLTHLPLAMFPSILGELSRTLAMAAGWAINLLVAEWIIRHKLKIRPARSTVFAS